MVNCHDAVDNFGWKVVIQDRQVDKWTFDCCGVETGSRPAEETRARKMRLMGEHRWRIISPNSAYGAGPALEPKMRGEKGT